MRRICVAAAIVVLGALAFAGGAQACSCLDRAPREALRDADAAIVGQVVEVVPRDDYSADYRVRVHRVFKGGGLRRGMTVTVRSGSSGAACGLPRPSEYRYGMFLGRGEAGWRGSLCGLAAPRELAAAANGTQRNRDLDSASASTIDCAS